MFKNIYSLSDKGLKRKTNEDSFVANENLLVVSDGMGGYQNGDTASEIVVNLFEQKLIDTISLDNEQLTKFLDNIAKEANQEIKNYSIKKRVYKTIGATVAGIFYSRTLDKLAIFHMGDSRVYRLRNKVFQQLTKDHTYKDNVISKAIGNFDPFELEVNLIDYDKEDIYIVCSDGINNFIYDEKLQDVLISNNLKDCCEIIKNEVYSNKAKDNLTLIVASI